MRFLFVTLGVIDLAGAYPYSTLNESFDLGEFITRILAGLFMFYLAADDA